MDKGKKDKGNHRQIGINILLVRLELARICYRLNFPQNLEQQGFLFYKIT